ncbi:P-loop containing nucleoside triphosphate hydrolase protein [Amylocarpus encephaloides]|uniref:P-loop containing nucleoside triphosphate hydrolase protein n=1 Tax=Amylocarpus encephaloides TaxID=45428 RepID=A0A9P7YRV3_9HELO|nr:P-loop containing nucleoside triphosphate hydrolase protein [Amylocarpus encephaloides]
MYSVAGCTRLLLGQYVDDRLLTSIQVISSISSRRKDFESGFNGSPAGGPHQRSRHDCPEIAKYIPVGSLRIHKSDVDSHTWEQGEWGIFTHPRDVYSPQAGRFLPTDLQTALLQSPVMQPYRGLHNAEWIRMEFKTQDQAIGQTRVYILPDDVGRASIDRDSLSLRGALRFLLARLDISPSTWNGHWSENLPIAHVDCTLDEDRNKDGASLFRLFNTLPSPTPNPDDISDPYIREAMTKLLSSDVEGLKTTMYKYQRRSAALMLQREAQPARIIDPRLTSVIDQKGEIWYCDIDVGSCLSDPRTYDSACGGVLAETMGLGKTLISLSLILASRELSSHIPVEHSVGTIPIRKKVGTLMEMAASTVGRTGTPWKDYFAQAEADAKDMSPCVNALKEGAGFYFLPSPTPIRSTRNPVVIQPRKIWLTAATLVVVPANLIEQWRSEIVKHTVGLKVLYLGNGKRDIPTPPAKELAEYDIIIYTKPRFDRESKDGYDKNGRHVGASNKICNCPYIGATRERACACFREEDAYHSPLTDLHFKRLITDEGHNFGNASKTQKTEAITVVDSLQLDARWIVSGTPTQGLYGAEVPSSTPSTPSSNPISPPLNSYNQDGIETSTQAALTKALKDPREMEELFHQQERKDLEKLGNIATSYLKARPWANTRDDNDAASWTHHVMQPRHGSKSRGNMDCLRATLESMIIRHRPEDIQQDIALPPLSQEVIYLDGSTQDKLSLNTFSMMIVGNAVTSERKDLDYLFHPRQRKALQELVSNLRQASFFWSGFSASIVQGSLEIYQKFLQEGKIEISAADRLLLEESIRYGEMVLSNKISPFASAFHEMPMFIQNELADKVQEAWALDKTPGNPTLMSSTMVYAAQEFVYKELQSGKEDPAKGLVDAGRDARSKLFTKDLSSGLTKRSNASLSSRGSEGTPILAGGVALGDGSSPRRKGRSLSTSASKRAPSSKKLSSDEKDNNSTGGTGKASGNPQQDQHREATAPSQGPILKPAMKKSLKPDIAGTLDPSSQLASAKIISTASAKLSYLMDKILLFHKKEKILVFYESQNVAWYIAQALECLGVKHLIYDKSLKLEKRAEYVVTFNQTDSFPVLLMDVSQAAFGLDMSSASRVFFVNPIFSPQVEAQAVKRAHRIGQTRPVFVETLVLKGSIEEVILERRKTMSSEEHNKCKNILDDGVMYDWIRNARFLHVKDNLAGPEQMAKLSTAPLLFGRGTGARFDTPTLDAQNVAAIEMGGEEGLGLLNKIRTSDSKSGARFGRKARFE